MTILVLLGLCGILGLENRAVRRDQAMMRYAYGSFLARRVHGKPLSSMIHVNSLAVFRSDRGDVACSILRGTDGQ